LLPKRELLGQQMMTIRIDQLSIVELPSATQTDGRHWAFSTGKQILKVKHDSVMSTAKAIYDEWSGPLNSTTASDRNEVFRKTCDLLNFGLVDIEFTPAAARRLIAAVDAWATGPRRAI
jgi:hypothetical protein